MTAKLAGAALIVAGAVWCCAARRRRQRQRLTLAQALAQALSAMETGIRWQRRPTVSYTHLTLPTSDLV